jgi:hypothetical protein
VDSRPGAGFRTLRIALPNGHEVEVRFPAYTYTPLQLLPGNDVRLSLRKEGLVIVGSQRP